MRTEPATSEFIIRRARPADRKAANYICLKTGDSGKDGEPFYQDDPDALARIYVEPYFEFEPELGLILEDKEGVCGYAFGALDSRSFFDRYEREWRPRLCAQFPEPTGDPQLWTRTQQVHYCYHHPEYFCPEPYGEYPSHMHIDLLERARGQGFGRQMMTQTMEALRARGSPGAHLAVSIVNLPAVAFYQTLGFRELTRTGAPTDGCIYMGKRF